MDLVRYEKAKVLMEEREGLGEIRKLVAGHHRITERVYAKLESAFDELEEEIKREFLEL